MNQVDEEEVSLSFLQLLKVAFGINKIKRIVFLIVTACMALLTILALVFIVNAKKKYYKVSFAYDISAIVDGKYLDGTTFNINSLVAYDNLVAANETSGANVNVDKLYNATGITITVDSSNEQYPYTIITGKNFYSSKSQAKEFIAEVVKLPLTKTENLVALIDNTSYLKAYNNATSYDSKIDNLISQADSLLEQYDSLITDYPTIYISDASGSKVKLTELKNDAKSIIEAMNLDTLKNEVISNHYVLNYDEAIDQLEATKSSYETEAAKLQTVIDALSAEIDRQGAASNEINTALAEYLVEKAQIDYLIQGISDQITYGNTVDATAFDEKLSSMYDSLLELSKIIANAEKELYSSKNMKTYFATNNIVNEEGGLSVILVLLGSVVIGVLVAGFVNVVMDISKYKKYLVEKSAKTQA